MLITSVEKKDSNGVESKEPEEEPEVNKVF